MSDAEKFFTALRSAGPAADRSLDQGGTWHLQAEFLARGA